MLIAGLTGGIATGKSTVSKMFQRRGVHVIDFDVLSRIVVEPDKPAWKDIVDSFGTSALNEDRSLDRVRLGEIVFDDKQKRVALQGFIYPRLFEEYSRQIQSIGEKAPAAIVIADVPLLIEINLQSMFEKIIVVYATREEQIERLTGRDGYDQQEVVKRLEAQMPTEEKLKHADYVIRNSGSLEDLEKEVDNVYKELERLAQEKTGKSL